MQHVQLHATFFSYIRQVAKDKISSSEYLPLWSKVNATHEDSCI
jgi:hypothetical protein